MFNSVLSRFVLVLTGAMAVGPFSVAGAQPIVTPAEANACPGTTVVFSVIPPPTGGPYTFHWQIETAPRVWATMGNDPMPLPCSGGGFAYASQPFSSQTPVGVHPCAGTHAYHIRCMLTNASGSLNSTIATLTLCCPGDVNCDSAVNIDDLLTVIGAWGACAAPCPPHCAADINFDCAVNTDDLLAVVSNWN